MKLTMTMRDAFVRSVMDDVPQVEYKQMIRDEVARELNAAMPPQIKKLLNDPLCEPWLNKGYVWIPAPVASLESYAPRDKCDEFVEENADLTARVAALEVQASAQHALREALRLKLNGAARSCKTRATLVAMLPEFEKYVPADPSEVCKTLPALTNIVSDFVKAGWPSKGAA